jgi:omega-amidase
MNNIRIALCQLKVGPDRTANRKAARSMLSEAADHGANIVVLPEMFSCPYQQERFSEYAEDAAGETPKMLSEAAKEGRFFLVGGSFPEHIQDGGLYNSCYIFGPNGEKLGVHRKIHLFDVELSGGVTFQESATLSAGTDQTILDLAGIRTGIGICYDLRFLEYARLLALEGAQLLIYPGAFNPVTGPAHWELLLRARAVDNQVFLVGVSPAPYPGMSYQAYGHSMVVDPWGNVLADAETEEKLVLVDIDRREIERVRRELPVLRHRRTDLYHMSGKGSWEGVGDP